MKIDFIGIGSELLYGRVVDTNGAWLAKYCARLGLDFQGITLCKDEKDNLISTLEYALKRSSIVILSGGLGPTEDDLTKSILASYFKKAIVPSNRASKIVEDNYKRFGKEWKPDWNHYHHVPDGFEIFENHEGLAPGIGLRHQDKIILCAPGVPREFEAMVENQFTPFIKQNFKMNIEPLKQIVVRTRGVPEEMIFNKLAKNLWSDLSKIGAVSSLPQVMGIDIVLTLSREASHEDSLKKVKSIIEKTDLNAHVWQWGNSSLESYILEKCREKNLTISFSESCTGGLSSSRVTDIPGSSSSFLGGIITYANEAKENILGVKQTTILKHGAVSSETAKEMAEGCLKKFGSNLCISWTGIAGPGGGSEEKPVGTLALGWATSKGENDSLMFNAYGSRLRLKNRFSEIGLFRLLELIKAW